MQNQQIFQASLSFFFLSFASLPAWASEIFIKGGAFEYVASHWQTFITGTKELKRLKAGFLLKQIFDRFKNKTISLPPEQLLQVYSGHEITISSILNGLGVFEVFFIVIDLQN